MSSLWILIRNANSQIFNNEVEGQLRLKFIKKKIYMWIKYMNSTKEIGVFHGPKRYC